MAAWQRLPAGAACAGQGAPCPPVPAAQDQPLRGFVKPVLWYVPRLRGVFLRGSRVLPRRRHRSQRLSQRREGLGSSLPFLRRSPPLPARRSSPGQALSRTSDKPSAQNITRFHGGGEKKIMSPHCQAGFTTLPLGTVPRCQGAALGAMAARLSAPSLRDASSPARPSRNAWPLLLPALQQPPCSTVALNNNLLVNLEETVTLFLANHH